MKRVGSIIGPLVALWLFLDSPALSFAAVVDLGAANEFGILGLEGGTVSINSATSIIGNVGYGKSVTSTTNQKVTTFTGEVSVHSTTNFSYTPATFNPSGGIQVSPTGGALDLRLEQATVDALTASAQYAALSATHTEAEIGGPLTNQAALQQALVTSKGLLNVINLSAIDFKSDTLTIQGAARDRFIFNVAGNVDWSQSQVILDGVTANHVLFNFTNASTILLDKSSTVWSGTILAPLGSVEYHNPGQFTGAIVAKNISLHSDFNLTQQSFVGSADVGSFVWNDVNQNGVQDAGEAGVENVLVRLLTSTGQVVATTLTGSQGEYQFNGLDPDDYAIQVIKPVGYSFSPTDAAGDDERDSDIDPTDWRVEFALQSGQVDLSRDAGIYADPEAVPAPSALWGGLVLMGSLMWLRRRRAA